MAASSVTSNQQGLHRRLHQEVRRHLTSPYQKPYAQHSLDAFERLKAWLAGDHRPLVLDSCCGVGESTAALAALHSGARVLGVDKSAHRLDKHGHYTGDSDNYLVLRADLQDLWRLMADAGIRLSHHYLLYPNPWPKAAHLTRRWYAGPCLPALLALGGQLEVRSNWELYLEEFAEALALAGIASSQGAVTADPITPFERKYLQAGQSCRWLRANLKA